MSRSSNGDQMKLIAKDSEDLAVLAACLQDALVPVAEIQYLGSEQRFIMLLNRFRWERQPAGRETLMTSSGDASFRDADDYHDTEQRIHAGLCVDKVLSVRSRDIDLKQRGKFLSLLTLQVEGDKLNLLFSGGGVIQLTISEMSIFLKDMGESWPTQWRPDHDIENIVGSKG